MSDSYTPKPPVFISDAHAGHTSGPWSWEDDTLYGKEDGYTVEVLSGAYFPEENKREREDRRLIAAAPELLAALKSAERFLAELGYAEWIGGSTIELRAAISKAEGN